MNATAHEQLPHRALVAECLGTALLLAAIVGSGMMATKLAGGNIAIVLLANALATGAILFVLIQILGWISGAHFNPAVTLAFWIDDVITSKIALAYVIVQIVGGCLGVLLAHAMFDATLFQLSTTVRTGMGQWLAEAVAAFGLVLAILLAVHSRPESVPAVVGFYITSAIWFTASTSFANPAVSIARALTNTFAGIRADDLVPFILAQLLGAYLAARLARYLIARSDRPEGESS